MYRIKMMYNRLHVSQHASVEEIKTSYRKLILRCHPDKQTDITKKEKASEETKKLNEAYDILSDPYKKQLYDEKYLDVDVDQDGFLKHFYEQLDHFLRVFVLLTHTYYYSKTHCSPSYIRKQDEKTWECGIKLREIYTGKTCCIPPLEEGEAPVYIPLTSFRPLYNIENNRTIRFVVSEQDYFQIYDMFSPYDLICQIEISLFEYLYGKKCILSLFDDNIDILYKGTRPTVIIKEGYGLPFVDENDMIKKGNLHIFLELKLPQDNAFLWPQSNDSSKMKHKKQKCKSYIHSFFHH